MVDIPGNSSTTRTINVGDTASDVLEFAGDHDWFRITLTAGQSISISVDGITLEDPMVRIRDASGNIIFENDDINPGIVRDSLLAFTASYSGTYYIDVGAWDDGYAGTYQLSVSTYTPPPVATIQQASDQLVNGYWGGDSHHFDVSPGGTLTVNLTGLTFAGQSLARAALATWADVIGVSFVEVSSGGQIVFDDEEEGAFSDSQWSNGIISWSFVNVSTEWLATYGTATNSYSFQTYVHEVGHALGLGHAGNYNETARYPYEASFQNDGWPLSVMSYFSQQESTYFANQGFDENYVVTPMMADILAMSTLYGLSTTTRLGDTTYGPAWDNNMGALCIFDSGGVDTIDVSRFGGNQEINLNPGTFSNVLGEIGNVSIALGVIIENAMGSWGADTLIGNDASNVLDGGEGDDVLLGGSGNDILYGSEGNDSLNGGDGDDILFGDHSLIGWTGNDVMTGGAGHDTFIDTKAGLNGDIIADFGAGDRIIITDATLANFTFSLSGSTLSYTGGSLTLGSALGGTLVAGAAANGGVELTIFKQFANPGPVLVDNFGVGAGGWSSQDLYPRHVADMNGDGYGDIVGFGYAGAWVSYGSASGTFSAPGLVVSNFGQSAGWASDNQFHRELADLNGDGRADIIGFGIAGTWVSMAQANGTFTDPSLGVTNFGANQGWASQDGFARTTGDVNGDGNADIVGFGYAGTWVSLGKGDGTFQDPMQAVNNFGVQQGWNSDNQFHRAVADINGDGFDDIVGFGYGGTWAALSNGDGSFGDAFLALDNFGKAQGWSSQDAFPRHVADVNGDDIADIVGFGIAGTWVAYGQADGTFSPVSRDVDAFAANQGWTSDGTYHRELADLNGDGLNDIVGFGYAGVYAGYSQGDGVI